jgi:hypothetical protein
MTTIVTRGYEKITFTLNFGGNVSTWMFTIPAGTWTPQGILDNIVGQFTDAAETTLIATYDVETGKSRWAIDNINYRESGSHIEASPELSQVLGLGGGQITPALVKSLNFGVTYNFY